MTKIEIKGYLENYTERKMVATFKRNQGDLTDRTLVCLDAIEECVKSLPNCMGKIIEMYYMQGVSLREISKRLYLSKDTVARKRERGINLMSDCLSHI